MLRRALLLSTLVFLISTPLLSLVSAPAIGPDFTGYTVDYPRHVVNLYLISWDGVSSFTGLVYLVDSASGRVGNYFFVSGVLTVDGFLQFSTPDGHLVTFVPLQDLGSKIVGVLFVDCPFSPTGLGQGYGELYL